MLRPELHALADRRELAGARAVAPIRPEEIALLAALLEVFGQSAATRVGEYFRDTEFESAVREIETSVLNRPEAGFDEAALKEQFVGNWQKPAGRPSTRNSRESRRRRFATKT